MNRKLVVVLIAVVLSLNVTVYISRALTSYDNCQRVEDVKSVMTIALQEAKRRAVASVGDPVTRKRALRELDREIELVAPAACRLFP